MSLGALLLVVAIYDRMPDVLPVTRWTGAPRSLLVAFRIPAINLLAVLLIDLLGRVLGRSPHRVRGQVAVTALFLAAGLKSAIEAGELYALPTTFVWTPAATLAVVVAGLGVALVQLRPLLAADARVTLVFELRDRVAVALGIAGIAMFQVAPFA